MSRRRRRTRREGGASAPPSRYLILDNRFSPSLNRPESFRAWRGYTPPVAPYRPPPQIVASRVSTLDHPARRPRTVRPLIRTVLTDTQSPRKGTRRGLDAARRAALRSRGPSPWDSSRFPPLSMAEPAPPLHRTSVCASRAIRREVLFATGQTGAGSRSPVRRRNADSSTRC